MCVGIVVTAFLCVCLGATEEPAEFGRWSCSDVVDVSPVNGWVHSSGGVKFVEANPFVFLITSASFTH